MAKRFKLVASQIQSLVTHQGGCIATNRITVDGAPVGYMYREEPSSAADSGWRFLAGDETDEYVNSAKNMAIYSLNTISNCDPEVIPLLNAPIGCAFARDPQTATFLREQLLPPA